MCSPVSVQECLRPLWLSGPKPSHFLLLLMTAVPNLEGSQASAKRTSQLQKARLILSLSPNSYDASVCGEHGWDVTDSQRPIPVIMIQVFL